MAVAVVGDATTAVVEMAVHGEWSPQFGDRFSAGLRLCLASPCVSIIIDLHHLKDRSGLSMPFWMAAWRQARLAPSPVRLVFCLSTASALGRRLCGSDGPQPPMFASAPEARIAVAVRSLQADRLQARLPPRPDRVRDVRELAGHACHRWRLPHLLDDTALVASELASNAIEHAGTDFVVTMSRDAGRLHVAVQDGAPAFPRPHRASSAGLPAPAQARGRGLLVVQAICVAWGAMPTRGGKVVWATLT
ncbi:ATP-binding protein [Actinoplanes subtropicus]|uniref:ATP-binding protein n=1 Tax=Actinoplanes subtropicus TaxID=543632 RepID=UPI00068B3757|nr:ATP-binding protein [Actinoplanes subtropicus]